MAFGIDRRMREGAEQTEAVIRRDHHGFNTVGSSGREFGAVVIVRLPREVAAAMQPKDHRLFLAGPAAGRDEHIEVEAVLSGARRRRIRRRADLRAGARVMGRVAWFAPRLDRLRRLPTQIADRRRRERNAKEDIHAVPGESADRAVGRGDHRRGILSIRGIRSEPGPQERI
jgi:hypothetical protein